MHALRHERPAVALLLAGFVAFALWGAARNSVTFDENFHLPSGIVILDHGDFSVSPFQPPLVKVLCALAAKAAGARSPADSAIATHAQLKVGESFMRANAARYHAVFFAARLPVVALGVLLGLLVWRWSRRLWGARAALLSVALYVSAPETLAHAGLVGMDLPTGLAFTATLYAFWRFERTARWRDAAWLALAFGLAVLTRFTALLLGPLLVLLAGVATFRGALRRPRRVWLGLALAFLVAFLVVTAGYAGQTSFAPLSQMAFVSARFQSLQHALPWFRPCLPNQFLRGLDYVSKVAATGTTTTYLLGRTYPHAVWFYYPIALLAKWPIGFLLILMIGAWTAFGTPRTRVQRGAEALIAIAIAAFIVASVAGTSLNVGIRYLYPILPLLCIGLGRLATRRPVVRAPGAVWLPRLAVVCVLLQTAEMAEAAPWYLAFFNRAVGGSERGQFIVNDSNVDWGQGLLALRDEMARRGIRHISLVYHGTADPAVYGIDYETYLGGGAPVGSDWLAVSSYFFVGLSQRMMTRDGPSDYRAFDFSAVRDLPPVDRPAGCMMLFRVPRAARAGGP